MVYNKLYPTYLALIFTCVALFACNSRLAAQAIASKSLENNFDSFDEYKTSDQNKALHFAELIAADLDSTAIIPRAAEVYDYLAGENVWLDTAFVYDYLTQEQFFKIMEKHGSDKILFATDSPWSDMAKGI